MTDVPGASQSTAIDELRRALGDRVVLDKELMSAFSSDSSTYAPDGLPCAVVRARSTADVSTALAWASRHKVRVSVRGAGTGLSGGAVAYEGGLVISLDLLNHILAIDVPNRLADVEAGVVTADLDRAAREHGLFFAPDPASAHISTIGGNIATNAGGLRCIAHGVTRDAVAALEVVLADGQVLHTGARTRKNVAGYDLTSLFTGSEGTLGVITRATVRLEPVPSGEPQAFWASFDDIGSAGRAVTAIVASEHKPLVLELLDTLSVEMIEEHQPMGLPLPGSALLVGQMVGPDAASHADAVLELCRRHGAVGTALEVGDDLLQARRLANPALRAKGMGLGCDVGVPIGELAAVFEGIEAIGREHGRKISTVAHAGDGNLHPAVEAADTPEDRLAAQAVVDDIMKLALSLGGTITGEHGIGSAKTRELGWQLDEGTMWAQRAIKGALDPDGILTPGRAI